MPIFDNNALDTAAAGLVSAGRTATFGSAKYLAGGLNYLLAKARGEHPIFSDEVQHAQDVYNQLAQEHPVANVAGAVVGSVPAGVGIAQGAANIGRVAQGAGILGKAVASPIGQAGLRVAASGGYGAAQAAGNDQDMGEGGQAGLIGGVVGEGAGAVLSGAAQAGRKLIAAGKVRAIQQKWAGADAANQAKQDMLDQTLAKVKEFFPNANPSQGTLNYMAQRMQQNPNWYSTLSDAEVNSLANDVELAKLPRYFFKEVPTGAFRDERLRVMGDPANALKFNAKQSAPDFYKLSQQATPVLVAPKASDIAELALHGAAGGVLTGQPLAGALIGGIAGAGKQSLTSVLKSGVTGLPSRAVSGTIMAPATRGVVKTTEALLPFARSTGVVAGSINANTPNAPTAPEIDFQEQNLDFQPTDEEIDFQPR